MTLIKPLTFTKNRFVMLILLIFMSFSSVHAQSLNLEQLPKFNAMEQAGLLVLDKQNQPLISKNASKLFVPASTTKLLTAYLALQYWGADHQFNTDFYIRTVQDKTILWVKGHGDPFLVSEELRLIAEKLSAILAQRGLKQIDEIRLDTSLFKTDLMLPGTSESDNPYDAIPSALAANFNTLYLVNKSGKIESAEAQTPLTPLALELGKTVSTQKTRFNTGPDAKISQRYFAELLAAFMRQQNMIVKNKLVWESVEPNWVVDYAHSNSMTLIEIIRPMMKYSTNFIANQLALMMAADLYGAPVDEQKVKRLFETKMSESFNWTGALIEEGAGLSRNNRLSTEQLIELLQAFKPWKDLLPEIETGILAKSGSLIGVSTLAGYIQQEQNWLPFALMMNEKAPYRYRNKVARQLHKHLNR